MSQSDISPPWPPLFVTLFSHEEHRVDALLTEDSAFRVSDPKLGWNCVAQAPNGRQVVGVVSFPDTASTPYDRIVSLFSVKQPVELWFGPREKDDVIRDRIYEAKDASIALWADGAGQSAFHNFRFFQPDEQPYWLAPEVGAEANFVIETKDSDGRPSFASMRASDRLLVEATKADAAVPFLLRVTSPIGDHTAYWNFFRHGRFEAAYHVGRRIINRLPTLPSDARTPCDATTLAAAHAILRFGDLWEEAEPLVRRALAALEDNIDANMMLWVFCFERGDSEDLCRSRLRAVLAQVQQHPPIFSETFRLFYERMSSFSPLCNLANDAEFKGGVEHVERLMAASFLRNERLVYRGRSPGYPDASAPLSAGSAQKKTFLTKSRLLGSQRIPC